MIALFAGRGLLPERLTERLLAAGRVPILCELDGQPSDVRAMVPRLHWRLETLGTALDRLRALGVTELCLAGALTRPDVDPAAFDAATRPLMARLTGALARGDDGTLRALIAILEEAGFAVTGAEALLPECRLQAGVPTALQPDAAAEADAEAGARMLGEMGRADLGQACVVRRGAVVAREGPDGTDAMLARLAGGDRPAAARASDPLSWLFDAASDAVAEAADWLSYAERSLRGGILYKGPKPGQDRRADLPVIGPDTAEAAALAGLAGIVIEADGVLCLDPAETVRRLDASGLFLWVRARGTA